MSLDKEIIEERKQQLVDDFKNCQEKVIQLEKALEENRNLIHALSGAIQQCDDFLTKIGIGNNADSSIPSKKEEGLKKEKVNG